MLVSFTVQKKVMAKKIVMITAVIYGLMMLVFGLNKLFPFLPMPAPTPEEMKLFGAFITLKWVLPLVAVTEIIGGILLIIPRTRPLGAIVLLPVMIGIILHHAVHAPGTMLMPLVLFGINIAVIIVYYNCYRGMISKV